MQKPYPEYRTHLQGLVATLAREMRGPMLGFSKLHREAVADGALSRKVKELISLGISISAACDGCILAHVYDALHEGATREEIVETIAVAVVMGGGPALFTGAEALAAVDQFIAEGQA
jgi:AhpD family alkylhydroperoxidase